MNLEILESRTLLAGADLDTEDAATWSDTAHELALDAGDAIYDTAIIAKNAITATGTATARGILTGILTPISAVTGVPAALGAGAGKLVSTLLAKGFCGNDDCTQVLQDTGKITGAVAGITLGAFKSIQYAPEAEGVVLVTTVASILPWTGLSLAAEAYKGAFKGGEDTFIHKMMGDINSLELLRRLTSPKRA